MTEWFIVSKRFMALELSLNEIFQVFATIFVSKKTKQGPRERERERERERVIKIALLCTLTDMMMMFIVKKGALLLPY